MSLHLMAWSIHDLTPYRFADLELYEVAASVGISLKLKKLWLKLIKGHVISMHLLRMHVQITHSNYVVLCIPYMATFFMLPWQECRRVENKREDNCEGVSYYNNVLSWYCPFFLFFLEKSNAGFFVSYVLIYSGVSFRIHGTHSSMYTTPKSLSLRSPSTPYCCFSLPLLPTPNLSTLLYSTGLYGS